MRRIGSPVLLVLSCVGSYRVGVFLCARIGSARLLSPAPLPVLFWCSSSLLLLLVLCFSAGGFCWCAVRGVVAICFASWQVRRVFVVAFGCAALVSMGIGAVFRVFRCDRWPVGRLAVVAGCGGRGVARPRSGLATYVYPTLKTRSPLVPIVLVPPEKLCAARCVAF